MCEGTWNLFQQISWITYDHAALPISRLIFHSLELQLCTLWSTWPHFLHLPAIVQSPCCTLDPESLCSLTNIFLFSGIPELLVDDTQVILEGMPDGWGRMSLYSSSSNSNSVALLPSTWYIVILGKNLSDLSQISSFYRWRNLVSVRWTDAAKDTQQVSTRPETKPRFHACPRDHFLHHATTETQTDESENKQTHKQQQRKKPKVSLGNTNTFLPSGVSSAWYGLTKEYGLNQRN